MSIAPKDWIASLDKGLAVIRAFESLEDCLGVTEVARRAHISRTAARRYLLTLTELGYSEMKGKRFCLTPKLNELVPPLVKPLQAIDPLSSSPL